jgi:hypothetical protein
VGTEDARLPREDFGTSFWQLATVGYAGSGCVERAVMSLIGPRLPTLAMQQISGYLGYTGRAAKVIVKAALDPKRQTLETYCHSALTMRY